MEELRIPARVIEACVVELHAVDRRPDALALREDLDRIPFVWGSGDIHLGGDAGVNGAVALGGFGPDPCAIVQELDLLPGLADAHPRVIGRVEVNPTVAFRWQPVLEPEHEI